MRQIVRLAAMISAQVSSAGAIGSPTPSAIAMPLAVAAATSTWPLTLPVCEISFSFGSLSSKALRKAVRSRISTSASNWRQADRQLADAARAAGEHFDLVAVQQLEAVELADRILIVVENGNFHGS